MIFIFHAVQANHYKTLFHGLLFEDVSLEDIVIVVNDKIAPDAYLSILTSIPGELFIIARSFVIIIEI